MNKVLTYHAGNLIATIRMCKTLRSIFILSSFCILSFTPAHTPAPLVITELHLDEGTGTTTADASGYGHNGTLINGPTWVAGKYGQGVSLDGTNDYINIPDHTDFTLTPTVSYTWSAWVKNNSFKEWSTVWSQTINMSTFFYFYAHSSSDPEAGPVTNGISVYWYSSGGKLVLHSNNNVLTAGTWSYITVTYDASQSQANRFTIYVNGIDVTNRSDIVSAGAISTIDPTDIRIGSDQPWGEYLNGSVDEVRYYRRLLSLYEIQSDMNSGSTSSDTTPPTISITAPVAGNVSGTISVNANASDNVGVAGVQFLLDGNNLGPESLTSPYSVSWNTTTTTNGNHTLTARARDAAGNTTTSSAVIVNVNNGDITPPAVSITAPANNATVSGTINVAANASDNVSVAGVQFLLDGSNLGSESLTSPYSVSWNTTTTTNGNHTLTARARDAAGNTTTSTAVIVNVNNGDITPPAVSITAPANNATVSGTINVTANASDNVSVAGVQFLLDGSNLGSESLTSPYSVSWNTTTTTNGNHTLTARARDAAGNTATSTAIIVNVNNVDATPPTVSITSPANNATVSGTITVTANASDNLSVAGVQFLLDGNNLGSEDVSSPYSVSWNTTTISNGNHTLTARARDAAGNISISSAIVVTVNNSQSAGGGNLITAIGFSEGTGTTAADLSGKNHPGTLYGSATWTTGKFGQAVSLNGTSSYVNIADHTDFTLTPTTSYTWSAWVKNTNFNEWSPVWSQTVSTSTFFYFYAHSSSDAEAGPVTNGVSVYWYGGGNKLVMHSNNNVLTAGTWSYITITYDASQSQANRFTIYVNGVDVSNRSDVVSSGTIATIDPTNIRIGSDQPYSEFLNGAIDEVRYYNRLLTQAEIQNDMNTPIGVTDNTAPVVSISSPTNSTVVSATINVTANASDNVGVAGVQFLLDGNNLGAEDVSAPYSVSWNTLLTNNGTHTISARARDAAGNTTTSTGVIVTVNNDVTAPTVSITSPTGGNVSGTINVNATASDNGAIAGVQFLLDGGNLGAEDLTAPYSVSWNTTLAVNGTHTLSARARDTSGNVALASNVNVTVANTTTTPIISAISVGSITESSAIISWTTNVPSTSQVNYGTTAGYGLSTLTDLTLVTSHSQILNGLAPGTLYHYQVFSGNPGGNPSGDYTFTTASLAATLGTMNTHTVFAYPSGKIVPWTPNPTNGYDTVMDLTWNYLLNLVPNDPSTGMPAYYSRSYLNPNTQQVVNWPHNPAGLYGMLIESATKYYGYSGNANVMQLANNVATWHLDHGMTTASDSWSNVPYSEGQSGSTTYGGAPQDGVGVLEPDKIGELGYGFLQLYKYNGNTRFRDAAIQAANVLSSKIRVGNTTQSPWPFRVNAHTGSVVENYCSDVIGPISLLDGLIAAGLGDTATYRTTRNAAWNWMMTYPMVNNVWAQYFEDVGIQGSYNSNLNQYNAMITARYILLHPEMDANWETHVRGLITWVENNFLRGWYGANTIEEQQIFPYPMGSHTSRYASVNALLYEKTGDATAKEKAYRSFNWATYMCRSNGISIDGPDVNNQWFTDGYGDLIRHFMTGVGAIPEWSPANQTHLVRSTSVIKAISYGSGTLSYTTYDRASTEVIHISYNPVTITANGVTLPHRLDLSQEGWTLDVATKTVRIYHANATQIVINPGSSGRLITQAQPAEKDTTATLNPAIVNGLKKALASDKIIDEAKQNSLVIVPNPASGNFSLNYTAINPGNVIISITDMSGKLVFTTNKTVVAGQNIIPMQGLASWKAGVYLISVQKDNDVQRGKLMYQ